MQSNAIMECVPNFSEGRDKKTIDAIAAAISSTQGVKLLDVDVGADTNRTVYTFAGEPKAVVEAALAAARTAYELIDMRRHFGAHPRMGALDVCPFVPVAGISMDECVTYANEFAKRLAQELQVPVYLYEKAARTRERESLANIRSGEYEGLQAKLADPAWVPDYGPVRFDPKWGATVAGAREFLVAYNVNLNTKDKKLANEVALNVREAGRLAKNTDGSTLKDQDGNPVRIPGRLAAVRAIGWYIEEYRCAQVSINLLDYKKTPLWEVYEVVEQEADKLGLRVTGSELVGLIPYAAIAECGKHYLRKAGKSAGMSAKELVEIAVQSLGLASVSAFNPEHKIIEWSLEPKGELVSLKVNDFADEVSSDAPAPGGGSVAALAGALGASLVAMVGNLTVGKKGYEANFAILSEMAESAQTIKDELIKAVDKDTQAFNAVMAAGRLPKATEQDRRYREAQMLAANEKAAQVPYETAEACLAALKACLIAVTAGNRNSVSDGAVGALMAHAGLKGAVLNVRTNLASIPNDAFARELLSKCSALEEEAASNLSQILSIAETNIGKP